MAHKTNSLPIWQLRRGMDRRIRAGHPWVYSNELAESPRGIQPGDLVELRDATGKFLARGFGNPQSLIAFRVLSRQDELSQPNSSENLGLLVKRAGDLRTSLGLADVSHRLFFGESDGIPGLVIDRYKIASAQDQKQEYSPGQVFVVQAHTAGADRLILQILEILEAYVHNQVQWSETAVVLRNDLAVRKLEGLASEPSSAVDSESTGAVRVLKEGKNGLNKNSLSQASILVPSVLSEKPISFSVDLIQGQKTGFFLDQFANIQLAAWRGVRLSRESTESRKQPIRILDLCSYVGQWGAQLGKAWRDQGRMVEVTAVDASQTALDFARKNVEAQGVKFTGLKTDVLKGLVDIPGESFDWVISDPPALIKSRKDIPQGTHAYLQLNTQVFRIVKKGGGVVCCSCSALLDEESFTQTLAKASRRNSTRVRWIGRGGPSPDHPVLSEFPEGRYLKCWVGRVDGESI